LLTEAGWRPMPLRAPPGDPGGDRHRAIAQVHCHQHAIMGFDADTEILRRCGVGVEVLDTGAAG
jgi:hypothetical protein